MDLSLDSTQQLIQESARDFVRNACGRDVLVKLDRDPAGIPARAVGQARRARLGGDGDTGSSTAAPGIP